MPDNILLDASFRGVPFDCQTEKTPTKRAIVVHEYPGKDGGEVDDMGRRARVYNINAIFWGDTYQDHLAAFIAALDEGGEGELIHPVYGSRNVVVQEFEAGHEADLPDSCAVSVVFVESGLHTPFFNVPDSARGEAQAAADATTSAMEEAQDSYAASLEAWVRELMAENPASNTLAAVAETFRAGVRMLDDVIAVTDTVISYLDFPRAFVGDLSAAYSKVTEVANLGDTIADRFTGWQRLSSLCKGVSASGKNSAKLYPTSPAPASITPPTMQEIAEDSARETGTVGIGASAPAAQNPLTADADTRAPEGEAAALVGLGHAVTQANEVTNVTCDILVDEADTPMLNPAEVEVMVNNARDRIQDAMAVARVSLPPHRIRPLVESLRDAAENVQSLGAAVINSRPPLVAYTLEYDCNAHYLAHQLYGDYARATEIIRLNPGIRIPSFLRRGQRIMIYAE